MRTNAVERLIQLNRHEDRHKLARAVFHGRRGELRQRYREGQEDQLGTLGLVVNIIILWNCPELALRQVKERHVSAYIVRCWDCPKRKAGRASKPSVKQASGGDAEKAKRPGLHR
jgi:hypothetical protein